MSEDLVEWIDAGGTTIGLVSRARAHDEGLLHKVSVVYLTRPNGDILVQQRMSGRFDHSAAGHVDPGETYEEAAARELFEELGVKDVALKEVGLVARHEKLPEKGANVWHQYKVFECEAEPLHLDPRAVKAVEWRSPLEIREEMADDQGDARYTGGFKATLELYMKSHGLL
jgi:isopentenyl-diphosphate delta-isomerase